MTQEVDLYKGYGGEPELVIFEKNIHNENGRRLWYGFFYRIMESIPMNDQLNNDDVLYCYQTQTGWYDEDNWECKKLEPFRRQLDDVDSSGYDNDYLKALEEVSNIVGSCMKSNNKLFFICD